MRVRAASTPSLASDSARKRVGDTASAVAARTAATRAARASMGRRSGDRAEEGRRVASLTLRTARCNGWGSRFHVRCRVSGGTQPGSRPAARRDHDWWARSQIYHRSLPSPEPVEAIRAPRPVDGQAVRAVRVKSLAPAGAGPPPVVQMNDGAGATLGGGQDAQGEAGERLHRHEIRLEPVQDRAEDTVDRGIVERLREAPVGPVLDDPERADPVDVRLFERVLGASRPQARGADRDVPSTPLELRGEPRRVDLHARVRGGPAARAPAERKPGGSASAPGRR